MNEVVMQARTPAIADLVEKCARGELPFSGPNSLYAKFSEMGFSTNGLYEQVMAVRAGLPVSPPAPVKN